MLAEAALAIGSGVAARSVLLIAFGVDSVIELLSGGVLLRRLRAESGGASEADVDKLDARTARVSAVLLILLCAYIGLSSAAGLLSGVRPSPSPLGLVVSFFACVVMPILALAKRRVNDILGSASLRADIAETISCAVLAGLTLAGLAADAAFGRWWIQYVAALAFLIWLVPETREAIEASRQHS